MKVISIISQNSFISKKVDEIDSLVAQHEVQMKMLYSHIENEKKSFAEKTKPIVDAIEKNLRESNSLSGEINDNRHLVISKEQDAIFICDHNQ